MSKLSTLEPSPVVSEIRRRMELLGMTPTRLSLKAGLNQTYVRDLFSGKSRNPHNAHLNALAVALGCTVLDLMDPRPAGRRPQASEVVDAPEELAFLRFWRTLSPEGKALFIQRAIESAPRPTPDLAKSYDTR
jgi:transcriptional regulator with XRE-family HTH domain